MVIGASAGYSAVTVEGMVTVGALGAGEQAAVSVAVGLGAGGIAGGLTSLAMGVVTNNDKLKNNVGDAVYIGMGSGVAGALTETFFAGPIEDGILGRIYLLPTPLILARI